MIAEVTFLEIPRPPHGYRYFGKGNYTRMSCQHFSNIACAMGFDDGKEYFDGDTTLVELGFYENELNTQFLVEGIEFQLFIFDLQIAKGVIL